MWKKEKYMNYMDNIDQAIKEYFNILEPEFPNWLNDYINIKELQKQNKNLGRRGLVFALDYYLA